MTLNFNNEMDWRILCPKIGMLKGNLINIAIIAAGGNQHSTFQIDEWPGPGVSTMLCEV